MGQAYNLKVYLYDQLNQELLEVSICKIMHKISDPNSLLSKNYCIYINTGQEISNNICIFALVMTTSISIVNVSTFLPRFLSDDFLVSLFQLMKFYNFENIKQLPVRNNFFIIFIYIKKLLMLCSRKNFDTDTQKKVKIRLFIS